MAPSTMRRTAVTTEEKNQRAQGNQRNGSSAAKDLSHLRCRAQEHHAAIHYDHEQTWNHVFCKCILHKPQYSQQGPRRHRQCESIKCGRRPFPFHSSRTSRQVEATVKARGTESEAEHLSQKKRERELDSNGKNEEVRDTDQKGPLTLSSSAAEVRLKTRRKE